MTALFEGIVKKVYEDGTIKKHHYQVVAESENMAYLVFGRVFHKDEYEVLIEDFRKVKELK